MSSPRPSPGPAAAAAAAGGVLGPLDRVQSDP